MIPKVKFEIINKDLNIDIIKWTYNETNDKFNLRENSIKCFPTLTNKNIKKVVEDSLIENQEKIKQSILRFELIWNKYNDLFMNSLIKVLNINFPNDFSIIVGKVGIVPICPRFLKDKSFIFPYWIKDEDLIDTVAHECCHFLYFEKWKQLFPNYNEEEFDSPHLIWKLSEMVIDAILNKEEIQKVLNHPFKSYDYFYMENSNEMNKIEEIYNNNNIEDAIVKSYEFLKQQKLVEETKNIC